MKVMHIKANGEIYTPQEPGEKRGGDFHDWVKKDVCYIKKLMFGRWQIDYYDGGVEAIEKGGWSVGGNQVANARLIIYPSGIEEIKYMKHENC